MGSHQTLGTTSSYASPLQLYLAAAATATATGSSTLCHHSNQQTSTTTTNSTINLSLAAGSGVTNTSNAASSMSSTSSLSASSSRFVSVPSAMGSLLLPPVPHMKLEDYSAQPPLPLALPPLVPLEAARDKEQALNLMRLPTPPTSATMEPTVLPQTTPHPLFQAGPVATPTPALLNLSMHGASGDLPAATTMPDEAALNFKLHAPLTPQTPPRLAEIAGNTAIGPQMQDVNIQTDTPVCSEDESIPAPCTGLKQQETTIDAISSAPSLSQPLELTKPSENSHTQTIPNECHTQTEPSDIPSASQAESAEQTPPDNHETIPPSQAVPEDLTGLELLSNISTNSTPLVRVKKEPVDHVEPQLQPEESTPPSPPPPPVLQMNPPAPTPEPLGGLKLLCALAEQRIQEEVVQGSSLFATPSSRTPTPTPQALPANATTPPGLEPKSCFGFGIQSGSVFPSSTSSFQLPLSSPGFPSMQGIELPSTSSASIAAGAVADLTPVKRKKHKHSKSSGSDSRKSARCSKKSKKKRRHSSSRQERQLSADEDVDLQDEQLQAELRSALGSIDPSYAQRFGQEVFSIMDNNMRMQLAAITRQYRKKKRKLDEISKHKKKKKCSKQQQQLQLQLAVVQPPVHPAPTLQQPQLTLGSTLSSVLG